MDIASILKQHENTVFFFSRDECKYCEKLARELQMLKIPFTTIKVEKSDTDTSKALVDLTGHKSYPMLYIGKTFIGGYTEFVKLVVSQKLSPMIKALEGLYADINLDLDDF